MTPSIPDEITSESRGIAIKRLKVGEAMFLAQVLFGFALMVLSIGISSGKHHHFASAGPVILLGTGVGLAITGFVAYLGFRAKRRQLQGLESWDEQKRRVLKQWGIGR